MGKNELIRPKGQALVVIALALVGLLAMVALAIDGSMVYADRREIQSAADNAAMSGAVAAATTMDAYAINHQSFNCSDSGVVAAEQAALDAAISRAGTYGYTIDTDITDHNGVQVVCFVQVVAGLVERHMDVRVEINFESNTGFTQVILTGGVAQTVEAVARVWPRRSLSMGNAIASLSTDPCPPDGIDITGYTQVNVSGGGVFSNSCLDLSGTSSLTINVDLGGIGYVDSYTPGNNTTVSPPTVSIDHSDELLPEVIIPPPNCLSLPDFGAITIEGTQTINPGRYSGIALGGSDHLIMNPGLYCLTGDFTTQGAQTVEVSTAYPDEQGVTIFMIDGDVTFNGNSLIILRAPTINMDPALKGMLIYLPPENPGVVTLTGTNGSGFRGTIYAPRGTIDAGGTVDIPFSSEFVAYNVSIHGNAVINVTDAAQANYTRPPMIELVK